MIQRIQSVYLFLAALFCVLAIVIPIPFAFSGEEDLMFHYSDQMELAIFCGVIAFVCLINIFLFKNRKLQVNIAKFNVLLTLILVGVAVYFVLADNVLPDLPHYGAGFPVMVLLANLLAIRGINADEKLVKSMDRLR